MSFSLVGFYRPPEQGRPRFTICWCYHVQICNPSELMFLNLYNAVIVPVSYGCHKNQMREYVAQARGRKGPQ